MANGSFLTVNPATSASCGNAWVEPTLKQNTLSGLPGYPYTISDVSVDASAIGAPYSTYSNGYYFAFGLVTFNGPSAWSPYFQWSTKCLPVVETNPVQCQATGEMTRGVNSLSAFASGCEVSTPIYAVNLDNGSASTMGACSDPDQPGKATIVIGSTGQHAIRLANVMFDAPAFNNLWYSSPDNQTYIVACTIDITPSVSFRTLNLSHVSQTVENTITGTTSYAPYALTGAESCIPSTGNSTVQASDFLTDGALASGAAGSWRFLAENSYADGWWETLCEITSCNDITTRVQPGKVGSIYFDNSRNQLEDQLGLASAVALGMFWGQEGSYKESPVIIKGGKVSLLGVRVGARNWWSVLYILPSVVTFALISWLAWSSRQRPYSELGNLT